jgi:flagellin
MALGVLNNLSAIYAENNLNNTNNSLQTVLEQLSSGSRINSGADDAAGLSLVNGLAANSAALTQSETNATEGVGLLQVADGALSQVTSLLDRAITLATEASNGTLNSTQESAANQEYQSILSEVNNIGQTTTYNQEQVFNGAEVAIYTGDSSQAGSSSDDLNIRSLSESSVGDTGGKMSYSSGANSVFVNLSTATQNAKSTDALNSSGETTIDVTYLLKGGGTESTATTSISVGGATGYANTVSGLVSAINNQGSLGLSASFTTQAQAGVQGGGTQTGIEITGGLISAGVDPSSSSTSGELNPAGIPASELLTQGKTVTIDQGGTAAIVVPINSSINTLTELAAAINTGTGASTYTAGLITASVITNGDGTQSLSLANFAPGDGTLSVTTTTTGAGALAPILSVSPTPAINAPPLTPLAGAITGIAVTPPTQSSVTFGVAGTGNLGTDVLSAGGSIIITNTDAASLTFIVGSGLNAGTTYYTQNTGGGTQYANTLAGLAQLIQAQNVALNANAAVTTTGPDAGMGITVTAKTAQTGENLSAVMGAVPLTNANAAISLYNPTDGGAGTYATAVLQLSTGNLGTNGNDITNVNLTGQIEIQNGAVTNTFIMGVNPGGPPPAGTFYTGFNTVASLVAAINADAALGLAAVAPGLTGNPGTGGIYLQASVLATAITTPGGVANTLANAVAMPVGAPIPGVTPVAGSDSSVTVGVLAGGLDTGDTLTGSISITNNTVTHTFSIGSGVTGGTNTALAAGTTIAQLAAAITGVGTLGLIAQANTTGITLTSSAPQGTAITVNSSSLADTNQGTYSSMTLGAFASKNDTVSGTISFSLGGTPWSIPVTAGDTVAQMIDKINGTTAGGSTYPYDVTASWVAGSNGYGVVKLASNIEGVNGQLTVPVTSVTDTTATAALSYSAASAYNTGLSNSDLTAILYDAITGQTQATFVDNTTGASGIATVSYTDGAGQSLSSTDLLNQADAESALNDLNVAITDAAAQDGYIGAQINTLNSISQVMSTQQENVVSAQNAIQATDYASATSNMSKYEILSQTGIAALAQANSVEQEVTKLLQ